MLIDAYGQAGDAQNPELAIDAEGNVFAVWQQAEEPITVVSGFDTARYKHLDV